MMMIHQHHPLNILGLECWDLSDNEHGEGRAGEPPHELGGATRINFSLCLLSVFGGRRS